MAEFSLTRTAHPTSDAARQAALADPGFGRYYVDHMVVIDYVEGDGWQDPRIIPMGDAGPLAVRVLDACERRRPRVFYPALYDVAGRVPGLAARFTRAMSPMPPV